MSSLKSGLDPWVSIFSWDVASNILSCPFLRYPFPRVAYWSRYQRAVLLEILNQDYIRTARGKGLKESKVIFQHAFRSSLIPMVTLAGLSLPELVNGAYITEAIFGWPGMGRLGISAIMSRDYPVVMGVTMLSALLVVVGNLLADVCYAVVDPRISHQ